MKKSVRARSAFERSRVARIQRPEHPARHHHRQPRNQRIRHDRLAERLPADEQEAPNRLQRPRFELHAPAELAEDLDGDRQSQERARRELAQPRHAHERHADRVQHLKDDDAIEREAERHPDRIERRDQEAPLDDE